MFGRAEHDDIRAISPSQHRFGPELVENHFFLAAAIGDRRALCRSMRKAKATLPTNAISVSVFLRAGTIPGHIVSR